MGCYKNQIKKHYINKPYEIYDKKYNYMAKQFFQKQQRKEDRYYSRKAARLNKYPVNNDNVSSMKDFNEALNQFVKEFKRIVDNFIKAFKGER